MAIFLKSYIEPIKLKQKFDHFFLLSLSSILSFSATFIDKNKHFVFFVKIVLNIEINCLAILLKP